MIIHRHSLPIFHGCSEGEDSVLFRDHVERFLADAEAGTCCLPPDVRVDDRKCLTCTDRLAGRRRGMLRDFIAAHIGTYHMLSCPTPLTVYRKSGERNVILGEPDTVTGWLRVFVETEAVLRQARAVTRESPNEIARKPDETVAAAADRLIDTFRAVTVDRDRPRLSEISFLAVPSKRSS